jgi:hypothetical protein
MDEEDRKAYLDERLAGPRLAANIAGYTPSTGPIVSLWNMSGGTLFPKVAIPLSRASGLDNAGPTSNPTVGTLDRLGSGLHDIGETNGKSLFTNGRYALPFQNTIWGDGIINSAASAMK